MTQPRRQRDSRAVPRAFAARHHPEPLPDQDDPGRAPRSTRQDVAAMKQRGLLLWATPGLPMLRWSPGVRRRAVTWQYRRIASYWLPGGRTVQPPTSVDSKQLLYPSRAAKPGDGRCLSFYPGASLFGAATKIQRIQGAHRWPLCMHSPTPTPAMVLQQCQHRRRASRGSSPREHTSPPALHE